MSYYGILNKLDFENELLKKIIDENGVDICQEEMRTKVLIKYLDYFTREILIEKGIFNSEYISDFMIDYNEEDNDDYSNPTFEDFEESIDISNKLSLKVYEQINNQFRYLVLKTKFDFFESFESNSFGVNYNERKKNAIIEFNYIYNSIDFKNIEKPFELLFRNQKQTFVPSKYYNLWRQRQVIINKINPLSYVPFLIGDNTLYNVLPYYNEDLLNEIIEFQIKLDILVELNELYNLETDIYLNNIFMYKISSVIQEKFVDSKSFVFTMYTIDNFEIISRSKLESLFEFLVSNNLYLSSGLKFLEIINKEFGTNHKTLKKTTKLIGEKSPNEKRIENHKIEWETFKKKYFPEE